MYVPRLYRMRVRRSELYYAVTTDSEGMAVIYICAVPMSLE